MTEETESERAGRVINEAVAQQLHDAEEEMRKLRALLERPVNVTVQSPEQGTLRKSEDDLPQLTHMSTNRSHVASAVQAVNQAIIADQKNRAGTDALLERIATALEAMAPAPETPAEEASS